ncbi:MAG: hypothetical protein R2716_05735 [Microthrixaceae bacterium]
MSIQVDKEDPDPGDEPYVIQLGFWSKLGVEESSSAFVVSQCRSAPRRPTTLASPARSLVPAGSADVTFPGGEPLTWETSSWHRPAGDLRYACS